VLFYLGVLGRGVLSAELHCHSSLSYDGRDPIENLLERAAALDLDVIAVTDHDEIAASLEAVEMAPDFDLVGIPAVEVTCAAGHVLALGVRELVPAGLWFGETLDRIHALGGIAVVPHPFHSSRSGVMANITRDRMARADAIEVYNTRLLTGRANRKAKQFAHERGLPMTAGSDAHIAQMVGRAVTAIDAADADLSSILTAIREGRTSVEGQRTPWYISFRQAASGAKRRVRTRLSNLLK
jgi:predicted metal-dependent phosphoesterase TrpH